MTSRAPRLFLALGLLFAGRPLEAQSPEPGWVGISVDVKVNRSGARRVPLVIVSNVGRGSPAETAGIEVGDRVLAINGLTRSGELLALPQRLDLRAGDPVRILVERGGRRFDLTVRADRRPLEVSSGPRLAPSFDADSMVESMFIAMDSLRLRLSSPGYVQSWESDRQAVRMPFEFFVFRGEAHDSLRRAMDELNGVLRDLQLREKERLEELASVTRSARQIEQDGQLRELRRQIQSLTRQSASLSGAMADAARASAGSDYDPPREQAVRGGTAATDATGFRPLTPYLLGSNRVAGAQVIDLRPELAEYFEVEGGVLIVDIASGSPAAVAGMQPGDVVTRMDQVGVRSVEELRFGVSQSGETLPITLVRHGTTLQVLLSRR